MSITKKEWKKPELIVLVRSKPEESVLTPCKIQGVGEAAEGISQYDGYCVTTWWEEPPQFRACLIIVANT